MSSLFQDTFYVNTDSKTQLDTFIKLTLITVFYRCQLLVIS